MPTLEVTAESGEKEFFELSADETIVGRDQFCDIVLRRHTVSRQHARIVRAADGFYIEDLSSLNGTYLNGRRLEERTLMKDQDRVHIYEVVAVFHEAAPDEVRAALAAGDAQASEVEDALPEELAERTMVAQPQATAADVDASSQARFRAALKISLDLEGGLEVDEILPKILDGLFEIFTQADADTFCWPRAPTDTWCLAPSSIAAASRGTA